MGAFLEQLATAAQYKSESDTLDVTALVAAINSSENHDEILKIINKIPADASGYIDFVSAVSTKLTAEYPDIDNIDVLTLSPQALYQLLWKVSVILKIQNHDIHLDALYIILEQIMKLKFTLSNIAIFNEREMLTLYNSCIFAQTLKCIIEGKDCSNAMKIIELYDGKGNYNFKDIYPSLVFITLQCLRDKNKESSKNMDLATLLSIFTGLTLGNIPKDENDFTRIVSNNKSAMKVIKKNETEVDENLKTELQNIRAEGEKALTLAAQTENYNNNLQFVQDVKQGVQDYSSKSDGSSRKNKFIANVSDADLQKTVIALFQYVITRYHDYEKDTLFTPIKQRLGDKKYYDLSAEFLINLRAALAEAIKDTHFKPVDNLAHFFECIETVLRYFPGISIELLLQDTDAATPYIFSGKLSGLIYNNIILKTFYRYDFRIDLLSLKFLYAFSTQGKFCVLSINDKVDGDKDKKNSEKILNNVKRYMQAFKAGAERIAGPTWATVMYSDDHYLKAFVGRLTPPDSPLQGKNKASTEALTKMWEGTLMLRFVMILFKVNSQPSHFLYSTISYITADKDLMEYLGRFGIKTQANAYTGLYPNMNNDSAGYQPPPQYQRYQGNGGNFSDSMGADSSSSSSSTNNNNSYTQ